MTLGQRIMQIRVSCGLSQEEFGERLGTSRQTVSKWETDSTIPEIEKIVKISRLFSVTTDSLLVDGISTFDADCESFTCGIYRSKLLEIVETERVALCYYSNPERTVFGVKAYVGFDATKAMRAICEYHADDGRTEYAYVTDAGAVMTNCVELQKLLGDRFDTEQKKRLYRAERFYVARESRLPTVGEDGIKHCLTRWRMSTTLNATAARFSIFICTDKTEYTVDIAPNDANVYCAASFNRVTELGLFCGNQFFRIRNYGDNSKAFCNSFCELGCTPSDAVIPTAECVGGSCVNTSAGLFFGIKRYSDDEIVLCGCGGDEYRYSRCDRKLEWLALE